MNGKFPVKYPTHRRGAHRFRSACSSFVPRRRAPERKTRPRARLCKFYVRINIARSGECIMHGLAYKSRAAQVPGAGESFVMNKRRRRARGENMLKTFPSPNRVSSVRPTQFGGKDRTINYRPGTFARSHPDRRFGERQSTLHRFRNGHSTVVGDAIMRKT